MNDFSPSWKASIGIAILLFLPCCQRVSSQRFEKKAFLNGRSATWYLGSFGVPYGTAYVGTIDSEVFHSGRYSLRLQSIGAPLPGEFGVVSTAISALPMQGKVVRVSMWARTKDVTTSTNLWANDSIPEGNGVIIPQGTHPWAQYSFDLPVRATANHISLGAALVGTGTAWFDDFQVQVVKADTTDSNSPK